MKNVTKSFPLPRIQCGAMLGNGKLGFPAENIILTEKTWNLMQPFSVNLFPVFLRLHEGSGIPVFRETARRTGTLYSSEVILSPIFRDD